MSTKLYPNPLREGLRRARAVDPCLVVIFGATGDLAHRKLMPALYRLCAAGQLPRGFAIVAYASSDVNDEQYREDMCRTLSRAIPNVDTHTRCWNDFAGMLHYARRTADAAGSMDRLRARVEAVNAAVGAGGNYLFYLAVPPGRFAEAAAGLERVGLAGRGVGPGWRRIIVEKPFGEDAASAHALNECLQGIFGEEQIYRIDHYLGKETVQNLLVFRFANRIIEPLLNAEYVDHIQITVAESLGVGSRGAFYDSAGALRDIVQNHALQLMSLICMDRPTSLDPEAVRDEKMKVLRSVRPTDPCRVRESAVRGQYTEGSLMGTRVSAYRDEKDVSPRSTTETYVALRLFVDNPRWAGVPIYIRTGKRLAKRVTEIGIQLKAVYGSVFGESLREELHPNVIAINIQPDEGISVRFEAKVPGYGYRIQPVKMDFKYGSAFGESVPEAYERLLLDALLGDPSLFARADAVEVAWDIVDPIITGWREANPPVYPYSPGGWGPPEASDLLERDGRRWRRL